MNIKADIYKFEEKKHSIQYMGADCMKIFIENPAGTKIKKEYDEKSGKWIKKGSLAIPYPFPYGFISGTMQKDGDPLDVFLITASPEKYKRGSKTEARILGLAEFSEDGERDYKILAAPCKEKTGLNKETKEKLRYFLIHAFDNFPDKKSKFNRFSGKEEAVKEINKCKINKG